MMPDFLRQFIRRLLFPIGYLIVKLSSLKGYKEHLMTLWFFQSERTRLDGLIFPSFMCMWIRHEYMKEKDPDARERLKEKMMGGQAGIEWAKWYDNFPDWESHVDPLFYKTLDELLASTKGAIVMQLGCSSGREIQHFALRHPQHDYIGTDAFPGVIDYAERHRGAPKLVYLTLPVKKVSGFVQSVYPYREIIIFSDGTLQYVQPEHVEQFFKDMAGLRVKIVLIENASWKKWPKPGKGSRYRENLTFTHDYRFYAEKAGLKEIKSDLSSVSSGKTIHYFYYGESPRR
jgi:hypothetical protein